MSSKSIQDMDAEGRAQDMVSILAPSPNFTQNSLCGLLISNITYFHKFSEMKVLFFKINLCTKQRNKLNIVTYTIAWIEVDF